MTDRDTFAAAALTGLVSRPQWFPDECVPEAYRLADAMLRERGDQQASVGVAEMDSVADRKSVATPRACARSCSQPFDSAPTTHDAVPEATATNDGGTPKDADGTGSTPSKAEIDALEFVVEEGRTASVDDYGILRSWLIRLRPEWESQSYAESNEKRMNTHMNCTIDPAAYEGDIVSRLRHWRGLHLAHCGTLFEAAATEIEVQRACTTAARDEIARLREFVGSLRAAIETAGLVYRNTDSGPNLVQP
jgi:hypothetical protein